MDNPDIYKNKMIERVIRYEVVCDECKESYPEEFRSYDIAHFAVMMKGWKVRNDKITGYNNFYCPECSKKL